MSVNFSTSIILIFYIFYVYLLCGTRMYMDGFGGDAGLNLQNESIGIYVYLFNFATWIHCYGQSKR